MWEVNYYETAKGNIPVKDFIDKLPTKLRAKAAWEIELLQELGTDIREPYSKFIKDGLFELRVEQQSDIVRIFYFFVIGKKIILTNGFTKKTQKTPPREIELALNYKKDYELRYMK
jgi:phage-related protein